MRETGVALGLCVENQISPELREGNGLPLDQDLSRHHCKQCGIHSEDMTPGKTEWQCASRLFRYDNLLLQVQQKVVVCGVG